MLITSWNGRHDKSSHERHKGHDLAVNSLYQFHRDDASPADSPLIYPCCDCEGCKAVVVCSLLYSIDFEVSVIGRANVP